MPELSYRSSSSNILPTIFLSSIPFCPFPAVMMVLSAFLYLAFIAARTLLFVDLFVVKIAQRVMEILLDHLLHLSYESCYSC